MNQILTESEVVVEISREMNECAHREAERVRLLPRREYRWRPSDTNHPLSTLQSSGTPNFPIPLSPSSTLRIPPTEELILQSTLRHLHKPQSNNLCSGHSVRPRPAIRIARCWYDRPGSVSGEMPRDDEDFG